ncbi:DNA polymerase II large subunit [Candidatus Bathyarchaeota archaeon]|nr:MAG: DNA polymerase II large subunit [Candidatus Bathyarchaeota archaeon]
MSPEYKEYIESLEDSLNHILEVAKEAREKGLDPELHPEVKIATDLAELVENFIGPRGVAERIRELSSLMPREEVAFKIAEDIVYGRFGHLEGEEAAEQAIRTALAILTEGVTAAVYLEGIAKVRIKKNMDGTRYLAVYLAGPIRSAGGTETALTPVIADFVRKMLGLERYKPTEEEIGRFVEELRLYEREVSRFQYHVSDDEIRKALTNLPVEITGIQSDPVEVSSFRNLPRIETNRVRGGALRVVNDGIIGRASKVLAVVEDLNIEGWSWLKEIRKASKKNAGFMEDVPAGRPILSFPSRKGGFRLRYGRSRNTGLAAVGVNPLTMEILQNFLAGGTQLKIEAPGKAGTVLPVDSIEPPIVKLMDGAVVKVTRENINEVKRKVDKILFLGDLLISFGDFLYNNRTLLPSGYTEEWWSEELKSIIAMKFNSIKEASAVSNVREDRIKQFLQDPFNNKPTAEEAFKLSLNLGVPLHPAYTFFWSNISTFELEKLREWVLRAERGLKGELITKLMGDIDSETKRILEKICVPHKVRDGKIIIEGDDAYSLSLSLGVYSLLFKINHSVSVLENVKILSGITIRDKAPTFIGARVGRPEAAKRREMKPPVHVLFPVGLSGGSQRNLMEAYGKKVITVEIVRRKCPSCGTVTFKPSCPVCGLKTILEKICPKCGRILSGDSCPVCGVQAVNYMEQKIPIKKIIDEACEKIGYKPKIVKGVKGLTNKSRIPEPVEKGILRAKYDLSVYKDGTVRFDATNAPLTHFKPSEIRVPVEKLRELGYTHDYHGNPLKSDDQICELKLQDIIIPEDSVEYLIRAANFIDELLVKVYGLKPFYNVRKPEDLIGTLVIGLAPHTCAGVLGRIIGFTKLKVCYAHPLWHSAKRRDCDGDEDSIMLALDAFLNFSKSYLPAQIGGIMDSPLFIIKAVNPREVQRQAHEIDIDKKYPLSFYENTLISSSPREISKIIDLVKYRFGSDSQYQGFGYTTPTSNINAGNNESIYKILRRMSEKLDAQLRLAEKIEAVDASEVARIVLDTHFIRDIAGNLRAFATQSFRCKRCNKRFRRIPLKGTCPQCGGEITLTVYRGGIEKYLKDAKMLAKKYGLPPYYMQRISLMEEEINSLFEAGKEAKQTALSKFIN